MARFFINPFASGGDYVEIPNDSQPSGSVSYESGYTSNYELPYNSNPAALPIDRDSMNGILFDITNALQEWQTQAFPDFITSADNDGTPYPYPIYACVRYSGNIYENLVNNNTTIPGSSSSWQIISGGALGFKPGDLKFYGGGVLQTGFLSCNGQAVSRTTYSALFAAIGTTWGAGDGSTTFNVPDFRGKVPMGSGGASIPGIIGNAVGNVGGEAAHILNINELTAHVHGPGGINNDFTLSKTVNNSGTTGLQGTASPLNYAATTQTASAGGGEAFNIIQPSAVCLFMIKY